jgi:hypothetical protein
VRNLHKVEQLRSACDATFQAQTLEELQSALAKLSTPPET